MGNPDFAVPSLQKLVESSHTLQLVVTGHDKRRGRRQAPTPTPVKKKAMEAKLPVWETDDIKDQALHNKLESLQPDLIVIVAFKILPESLLRIPKVGAINLHASLLPKYRGAAPIHHAVINGETETGCTVFFLNKGVDTGKIIDWRNTSIGPDETTGEVYQRLMVLGSDLLVDCTNAIAQENIDPQPQDETKASPAPKIYKEDCRIDFSNPAEQVHNFIRGLSPFPGAWTVMEGSRLNVYRSKLRADNLEPGSVINDDGKLVAGCGRGSLELVEVQLEGRKQMGGEELLRGLPETPARLGNQGG